MLQHHGELFVGLHPGSWTDGPSPDQQHGIEGVMSFNISVTQRIGKVPDERLFHYAYSVDRGVAKIARQIYIVLRRDRWQLQTLINAAFDALPSDWKLVEPFRPLVDTAQATLVGPGHFGVNDENADQRRHYGLWLPMEFGEGRFMAHLIRPAHLQENRSLFDRLALLNL